MSRALDVGCVNDITWRPVADGSTMVSSSARIMARGGDGTSPLSRGLEKVLEVPLVGAAMRVGVEKAGVHLFTTTAFNPDLRSSVFYSLVLKPVVYGYFPSPPPMPSVSTHLFF